MRCNFCGGNLVFMGNMGPVRHYRCQGCGLWFNKRMKVKW